MGSLEVKGLTFRYPEAERPALSSVSLEVAEGAFAVVCGRSGCGKSTLLRHFKTALAPHGERSGQVLYDGVPISEVDARTQAARIAFVLQNPDNQIVTDTVWHELAFGLESLGLTSGTIRVRVAEMASFFGIQEWFERSVTELSGGQKQLLNLASAMAMQPSVLVLDEPTSQLDPIAATEFLETVRRINRELGTTVVISEQRLEEVLPMADRALVLDAGRLVCHGDPRAVCCDLAARGHGMFGAMPSPAQIAVGVEGVPANPADLPLTVREGRTWLERRLDAGRSRGPAAPSDAGGARLEEGRGPVRGRPAGSPRRPVLELKDVWFRYERQAPDVLRGLSLSVEAGEWHCIVGGNGAGKSTALGVMGRLYRPYRGKVLLDGGNIARVPERELYRRNLGVMPQNPQTLFVERTVERDLAEVLPAGLSTHERARALDRVCDLAEVEPLRGMHPFDLSGGEQQRVALAKVLLLEPRVLLLDEPTKGIDGLFKRKLAQIVRRLQDEGVTVVMVSHDVEFCARYADRCTLLFNGQVASTAPTREFFAGNSFYTTAANRMARRAAPGAVIDEDVIRACTTS